MPDSLPATSLMVVRDQVAQWRWHARELAAALAPDAVRVRMLYAPINPADLLVLQGSYAFALADGAALGAEGLGEVEAIGEAVRLVRPGDRVLPLDRGNWCRRRVVAETRLLAVPAGTDPLRAAMMRINPATACLLLQASGAVKGDCLVLNAGRSQVADWVRQLGKAMGIDVISLVRGPVDQPGFFTEGAELPVRPCAALDCVAGGATGQLANMLADGGKVLVYGHLSGEPCRVDSTTLTGKGLTVAGFSLRPAETRMAHVQAQQMWRTLWKVADDVRPEQRIAATFSLGELPQALERAAALGNQRVMLNLFDQSLQA